MIFTSAMLGATDPALINSWWQVASAMFGVLSAIMFAVWKMARKTDEVTQKLENLHAQQEERKTQVDTLTNTTAAQFDELRRGQNEMLAVIHAQQTEFVSTMNKFDGRLIRIETLVDVTAKRASEGVTAK